MQRHIPNFLTCCNLVCGCLGIIALLEGKDIPLAYFVWAACIFDFLDGFAARLLKISSPIGKELDSLADMVSFGVLPALLMYTTISLKSPFQFCLTQACSSRSPLRYGWQSLTWMRRNRIPLKACRHRLMQYSLQQYLFSMRLFSISFILPWCSPPFV